jgi:FMN phosphatase YigB (HAD superfamily)
VGFDLGETLYHYSAAPLRWLEDARPALEMLMVAGGVDLSKAHLAGAGPRPRNCRTRLCERVGRAAATGPVAASLAALFGVLRRSLVIYPGAVETLAALKEVGFAVGALTNVPLGLPRRTIQYDLERLGLGPYIDAFVTSFEAGSRKPRLEPFARLACALRLAPRQIAYVGNLPSDVSGSRAAGCVPILLDWNRTGRDYGQAATVHELAEIPGLLRRAAQE